MEQGEIIKKMRESKGLTQRQLSEGIISKNFLSRFERGESRLNSESFFALLERMNLSLLEYQALLTQGDHSQRHFYEQLKQFRIQSDPYLLEQLLQEEQRCAQHDPNIRHRHNGVLIEAHLLQKQGKSLSQDKKQIIQDYLFDVEDWGLYEIELFGNFIPFLNQIETHHMVKEIYHKMSLFNDSETYHRILCRILLNIYITDVAHQPKQAKDIQPLLEKIFDKYPNVLYYEKLRYRFFEGILWIQEGKKRQGDDRCRNMIDIFYRMEEYDQVTLHKECLDYFLGRGIQR